MFYTIYKTTNIITGKFYIGKHQTEDLNDDYMGSGKILKRAVSKYGIDNFHKEILHICESEKEMNTLEKILVVPDPEINYNLCHGGKGGFGFINSKVYNPTKRKTHNKKIAHLGAEKTNKILSDKRQNNHPDWIRRNKNLSLSNKKYHAEGGINGFFGKKHSVETKNKIGKTNSINQSGQKNSQYGTCWITNGIENKKIKKETINLWVQKGYRRGRSASMVKR
jgi:hypothetical protein